MLSKTESPGVANIETDVQRYNQTGSEFWVRNINGRAKLPDSTVIESPHDKTNKMTVRPAKTQISLDIPKSE